jgi:hypothetical protein
VVASILTRDVKVLTSGEEHNVPAPEGIEFYPPRLGSIGEAELYINAERTHAGKADANDELPGPTIGEVLAADARPRAASDAQTLKALASLKTVGWWIVGTLGLILIWCQGSCSPGVGRDRPVNNEGAVLPPRLRNIGGLSGR